MVTLTTDIVHSGSRALMLSASTYMYPYASTGIADVTPGASYTFSTWVKTASENCRFAFKYARYDASGSSTGEFVSPRLSGYATEWEQLTDTLVAPPNTTRIGLLVNVWHRLGVLRRCKRFSHQRPGQNFLSHNRQYFLLYGPQRQRHGDRYGQHSVLSCARRKKLKLPITI